MPDQFKTFHKWRNRQLLKQYPTLSDLYPKDQALKLINSYLKQDRQQQNFFSRYLIIPVFIASIILRLIFLLTDYSPLNFSDIFYLIAFGLLFIHTGLTTSRIKKLIIKDLQNSNIPVCPKCSHLLPHVLFHYCPQCEHIFDHSYNT